MSAAMVASDLMEQGRLAAALPYLRGSAAQRAGARRRESRTRSGPR